MFHTPNKNKANNRHIGITEAVDEDTPLEMSSLLGDRPAPSDDDEDDYAGEEFFAGLKGDSVRREFHMADQLSMRLLAVPDDDSEAEDAILQETLNIAMNESQAPSRRLSTASGVSFRDPRTAKQEAYQRLSGMVGLVILGLVLLGVALYVGVEFIGPPNQPVGPYELVERQVREMIVVEWQD